MQDKDTYVQGHELGLEASADGGHQQQGRQQHVLRCAALGLLHVLALKPLCYNPTTSHLSLAFGLKAAGQLCGLRSCQGASLLQLQLQLSHHLQQLLSSLIWALLHSSQGSGHWHKSQHGQPLRSRLPETGIRGQHRRHCQGDMLPQPG
jgi:hypothetical protein